MAAALRACARAFCFPAEAMVIFCNLFQVTDLLRMVCLTKDSAYLSEFLEEILRL